MLTARQHVLEEMQSLDDLYRAARRFCQEWETEPRKIEGLASVRVREAAAELADSLDPLMA